MITSRFPLGNVSFTDGYFSTLVGEATKQCYGVAAMAPRDMTDAVKSMVYGSDYPEKGVRVTQQNGRGHLPEAHARSGHLVSPQHSGPSAHEPKQYTGLYGISHPCNCYIVLDIC